MNKKQVFIVLFHYRTFATSKAFLSDNTHAIPNYKLISGIYSSAFL